MKLNIIFQFLWLAVQKLYCLLFIQFVPMTVLGYAVYGEIITDAYCCIIYVIVISLSKIRDRDWSYTRHVICTNNHC